MYVFQQYSCMQVKKHCWVFHLTVRQKVNLTFHLVATQAFPLWFINIILLLFAYITFEGRLPGVCVLMTFQIMLGSVWFITNITLEWLFCGVSELVYIHGDFRDSLLQHLYLEWRSITRWGRQLSENFTFWHTRFGESREWEINHPNVPKCVVASMDTALLLCVKSKT